MAQTQNHPLTVNHDNRTGRDYTAFLESKLPFVSLTTKSETPWWNLPFNGGSLYGHSTGSEMAKKLLQFFGSGECEASTDILSPIVTSMMMHFERLGGTKMMKAGKRSQSTEYQCFEGQYFGFFSELSKFIIPAAYMNWQGLTPENKYNPEAVAYPPVWMKEEDVEPKSASGQKKNEQALVKVGSDTLTMSSREIAELVNSRHDKVKQSIERLAERGVIALPPLGEYRDNLGRSAKEYRIGKRDSYVIVAQLSPEFTARLVDRWQELEEQVQQDNVPIFQPMLSETVLEIAKIHESIERLEQVITQRLQPINSVGFTDFARQLRVGRTRFFNFLRSNGILKTDNMPTAYFEREGYFFIQENEYHDTKRRRVWSEVRITEKGQELIRNLLKR